jgi:menaquinone-dependent protoporphyrinogen oxidase
MKILVTWGSQHGGTEGIAEILAEALRRDGIEVDARPAGRVDTLAGYDAVIVGGALYANRWHRAARRFVRRHVDELRRVPVWFFSSGPLDDSADRGELAPTGQVTALMARVGARGHVTFGGRLAADATGFPARAMAKEHAGDWRNPERIRAWADELARRLPTARPGVAIDAPAGSLPRLVGYAGLIAGAGVAALLAAFALAGGGLALTLHLVVSMVLVVALSRRYFLPQGARDPMPAALTFAVTGAIAQGVAAARVPELGGAIGIAAVGAGAVMAWLAAWTTGALMSTLPWPKPIPPT